MRPREHIIRLQHEIAAAIVRRDIATLDRLHAPEFVYIEGTGRVLDKRETLASYRTTRFRELVYDSLDLKLYGTTAVVTGWGRAVIEQGENAVEIRARVSRVHVRRDGGWPAVLYHVTRLPEPEPRPGPAEGEDAAAIRAARAALNRALVERDTAVFARYWLEDAHVTGGSGQILPGGRAEHLRRFAEMFAGAQFEFGERRPTRIEVNAADGLAAEHGDWVWRQRVEAGVRESRGRYLVMWRKLKGEWRIQSELYVTLSGAVLHPGSHRAGAGAVPGGRPDSPGREPEPRAGLPLRVRPPASAPPPTIL